MQLRIPKYASAPLDYMGLGKMIAPLPTKNPSSVSLLYRYKNQYHHFINYYDIYV